MKNLFLAAAVAASPALTTNADAAHGPKVGVQQDATTHSVQNALGGLDDMCPVSKDKKTERAQIDAEVAEIKNTRALENYSAGRSINRYYGVILHKAMLDFLQRDSRYCAFTIKAPDELLRQVKTYRVLDENNKEVGLITHNNLTGKPQEYLVSSRNLGHHTDSFYFKVNGATFEEVSSAAQLAVMKLKDLLDRHYKPGENKPSELETEIDEIEKSGDLNDSKNHLESFNRYNSAVLHKTMIDLLQSDPRYKAFKINATEQSYRGAQQFQLEDESGKIVGVITYTNIDAPSESFYIVSSALVPDSPPREIKIGDDSPTDMAAAAVEAVAHLKTILGEYYKDKK